MHATLRKILRSDEALTLLDDITGFDFPGCDWNHGGCLVLCKALLQLFPNAKGKMIVNLAIEQPEHYFAEMDGFCIDGNGFTPSHEFLEKFCEDENEDIEIMTIEDWDEDCGVMYGIPTSYDTRLADFLNDKLRIVRLAA